MLYNAVLGSLYEVLTDAHCRKDLAVSDFVLRGEVTPEEGPARLGRWR